ncbi:MAG: hypothetical protein ABNO50_00385 [Candidatus Shikimatogenerans sp. Tduv]|uniref:Uncharacterized protein n=1 Tax=Candidatus Shikimatogenerans sp. Tduv TaxID=3158567 RepID=A0AAU7QRW7_9FLAO
MLYYNKIYKINNYKKQLKYLYILQLINNKFYNIFKYYNYKYLIYKKIYNINNYINKNKKYLNKKKKKYIKKYIKKKNIYKKIYKKKKYKKYLKHIFLNYKKKYILKYLKYKKIYNKYIKKNYLYLLKIYNNIIYFNNKILIYNKYYLKKLINYKIFIIKKINKYLLKYFLFVQKNKLNKKVVVVIINKAISTKNNILITPQLYINLLKKKKIILNELDGTILIDYIYAKKIQFKIKKKFKKL